jgi:hypothetical protein
VDTNVWLEHLLNQARGREAFQFITGLDSSLLNISHFSLHSICVILARQRRTAVIDMIVNDLFVQNNVTVRSVPASDLVAVTSAMQTQRLDFDDAYQYIVAKRHQLTLVSFDTDFDHTDLVRQEPGSIMATPPKPPAR